MEAVDVDARVSGTCIWHLMSSMGVKAREVNAPEKAPQATSAGKGSVGGFVVDGYTMD
jgi:hypothetical protein